MSYEERQAFLAAVETALNHARTLTTRDFGDGGSGLAQIHYADYDAQVSNLNYGQLNFLAGAALRRMAMIALERQKPSGQ